MIKWVKDIKIASIDYRLLVCLIFNKVLQNILWFLPPDCSCIIVALFDQLIVSPRVEHFSWDQAWQHLVLELNGNTHRYGPSNQHFQDSVDCNDYLLSRKINYLHLSWLAHFTGLVPIHISWMKLWKSLHLSLKNIQYVNDHFIIKSSKIICIVLKGMKNLWHGKSMWAT